MKYFYGIKPFEFIWHGEWADPEILYKGHYYNYNTLEDSLWSMFEEECPDNLIDRMTIVDRKTGNVFNVCRINKKYPNGDIYRGKWNFK